MPNADEFFGPAYTDIDEWRDEPSRHRYVHGGFEGTDTRFSFYFPPEDRYEGRFVQFLQGGAGGDETTAVGAMSSIAGLPHAFACGAYFVESNQGHTGDLLGAKGDGSIITWRASAASARYSKELAAEMYGAEPRHGYIVGGSGGGHRSIRCLESVDDVWDGGVSFLVSPPGQMALFSLLLNAARVLDGRLDDIADAVDVGGSGNPFAGLTKDQRDVLAALYRAGFARHVGLDPAVAILGWTQFAGLFETSDPTYFDDFWTEPGYLGADHPEALAPWLVDVEATVAEVVPADGVLRFQPSRPGPDRFGVGEMARMFGVMLGTDGPPSSIILDGEQDTSAFGCATVTVLDGAAAGRQVIVLGVLGELIVGRGLEGDSVKVFEGVQPGDRVRISNRDYLAFCHHYLHQVEPRYAEFSQFTVDGQPIYPQRSKLKVVYGDMLSFDFGERKMIIVQSLLDQATWPHGGVRYQREIEARLGAATADHFRVWFTDHAQHGGVKMMPPGEPPVANTRYIDYDGCIEQAIRDMIDWVESGTEPPRSTGYDYIDAGIRPFADADMRGGIQPVVVVTANAGAVARVRRGEEVQFEAQATVPNGTGRIVAAHWDFDGTGTYPVSHPELDGTQTSVVLRVSQSFDQPGTYFPAARVTSQRNGEVDSLYYRLDNLGRARVIVE